jgi:hypothetical protein
MASPDDLEALRYVAHTTRAVVVMLLLLRLAAAFWDCESSGSATSSSDVAVEWRRTLESRCRRVSARDRLQVG